MSRVRIVGRGWGVEPQLYYQLQQLQIVHKSFHTVPHIWNSLSNHVVSADTVNTFKHHLDKFWSNEEVIYNYKADLVGIGNHSIIN